jgi:hypothetical protein
MGKLSTASSLSPTISRLSSCFRFTQAPVSSMVQPAWHRQQQQQQQTE